MTNLKLGSTGAPTRLLQMLLAIEVTGIFNEDTDRAVRKFQLDNGLVNDGIVGIKTWQILTRLKKPRRWINEIIVHCSDTEDTRDVTAAEIDRWHKAQGWKGIGYHYVIRLDGTLEEGRDVEKIGSHCSGHNLNSIGIVYAGGKRNGKYEDTRTMAQKTTMLTLIRSLMVLHSLSLKEVHVHREFAAKACPCFGIDKLRKEISEYFDGK